MDEVFYISRKANLVQVLGVASGTASHLQALQAAAKSYTFSGIVLDRPCPCIDLAKQTLLSSVGKKAKDLTQSTRNVAVFMKSLS